MKKRTKSGWEYETRFLTVPDEYYTDESGIRRPVPKLKDLVELEERHLQWLREQVEDRRKLENSSVGSTMYHDYNIEWATLVATKLPEGFALFKNAGVSITYDNLLNFANSIKDCPKGLRVAFATDVGLEWHYKKEVKVFNDKVYLCVIYPLNPLKEPEKSQVFATE